ncbi:MAG: hypothetical protein ACRDHP_10940, partial [Ktedonobacterales bacterium]
VLYHHRSIPMTHAEHHTPHVHTAPVVLDIGADTGGLIIYTSAQHLGSEIEISPAGLDSQRVHTDVAERRLNGRTLYAAVYLPLPAGDYTIWGPDPAHPTTLALQPGIVNEVDWR